ncbi:MAG: toxin-antitoxin system YwqK family antitoxin [Thiomargarita sp.]|nr:toxin-antitoxin system YwqK family antitoxin [Thiomargarita sp.]
MSSFIKLVLLAVTLLCSVMVMAQQEPEEYYDSGALHFEHQFRNGKLYSSKEYYDPTGIKAEMVYKANKLIAKKIFRRNGDLEYELKYDDGKKIETQIEYYSTTGEAFRRRTLVNGKRVGLEIEYYSDGQTKAERNYINGKKEGSARGYHLNGKLQGDWVFQNGEPILATLFYSTGEKWLIHTDFDEKGRLNGVSKEYDKEGKLMALRYYKKNDMVKRDRVGFWLRWWWELRY